MRILVSILQLFSLGMSPAQSLGMRLAPPPHLLLELSLWSNDFFKNVLPYMRVNSRERVVQEVDISVLVHCPCQTHSLLLTST